MYEFLEYRVRDAMTPGPVTITPDAPLARAEALFEEHDFDALPVLEPSGRLIGVLSKLDLCRAFLFSRESKIPRYAEILARPVRSVMTPSPARVDPELPLTRALQQLVDAGVKSLPVVEGERLVGVIAREDVLVAIRRAAQGRRP